MDPRCRVELLGGLRVRQAGRSIDRLRARKLGALLAYLAYFQDQGHLRERLIEIHWPELEPRAARNNLSVALTSLRHILEPPGIPTGAVLVADRDVVRLNPAGVVTDVQEFRAALQAAARTEGAAEIRLLKEAAALYRGPLLDGCFEEWLLPEQRQLSEQFLQVLARLTAYWEQAGNFRVALEYASRALALDPLREEVHLELMRLLGALGQPEQGLRQHGELVRVYAEELRRAPSARAQALAQQLRLQAETQSQRFTVPDGYSGVGTPYGDHDPGTGAAPSGTVTFLFLDLGAGLEQLRDYLRPLLLQHQGHLVNRSGAHLIVAFTHATAALACSAACRRALSGEAAAGNHRAPVRMALHSGEVERRGGAYEGRTIEHGARLLAAGHVGQILCSHTAAALAREALPSGTRLRDLGVVRFGEPQEPERIYQLDDVNEAPACFAPLQGATRRDSQLPPQFNRFFGREAECARLLELLSPDGATGQREARLVTLTGAGGSGKTRLALQVGRALSDSFGGDVWFVPLADLTDTDSLADAIRAALELPRIAGVSPREQIAAKLTCQPSLVILDNLEQLLPAAALVVRELLERIPTLSCLVTSRHRLELDAEREVALAPLPTPRDEDLLPKPEALSQCASVRLFVDRAQLARQDFQVTDGNARAVAELCSRLEGLPLALELAAARAQVVSPAQMLQQLDRRFEFLVSSSRSMVVRHRTLQATIDWSFELLPPDAQRFFARLAVFRGGWTMEAAVAVCRDREPTDRPTLHGEADMSSSSIDLLAQLQRHSLIQSQDSPFGMRFRMLETVREFALEKLKKVADEERTRREHLRYFTALAEELEPLLQGPEQTAALNRLDADLENLRAALDSAEVVEGCLDLGLRAAAALLWYWDIRGLHFEARRRLTNLLDRPEAAQRSVIRAKALNVAGLLAGDHSDYTATTRLCAESHAISRELNDVGGQARALIPLGWVAQHEGNLDTAERLYRESLALHQQQGDRGGCAFALHWLGTLAQRHGDWLAARDLFETSLELDRRLQNQRSVAFTLAKLGEVAARSGDLEMARLRYAESRAFGRESQDRWSEMMSLSGQGNVALAQGDLESAQRLHQEALVIYRAVGRLVGVASCLRALGQVARLAGDWQAARASYLESLSNAQEVADLGGIAAALEGLALTGAAQGHARRAAELLGAAMALRETTQPPPVGPESADLEECASDLRAALGDPAFTRACEEGKGLSTELAVRLAEESHNA